MPKRRLDFLDTTETAQILRLKKHTSADLRRWVAKARRRSSAGERP